MHFKLSLACLKLFVNLSFVNSKVEPNWKDCPSDQVKKLIDCSDFGLTKIPLDIYDSSWDHIRLGRNPFNCDCSMNSFLNAKRLPEFLERTTDLKTATCNEPAILAGVEVLKLADHLTFCKHSDGTSSEAVILKVYQVPIPRCVLTFESGKHPSPMKGKDLTTSWSFFAVEFSEIHSEMILELMIIVALTPKNDLTLKIEDEFWSLFHLNTRSIAAVVLLFLLLILASTTLLKRCKKEDYYLSQELLASHSRNKSRCPCFLSELFGRTQYNVVTLNESTELTEDDDEIIYENLK